MTDVNQQDLELIEAARAVRLKAYKPYSGFAVGAALRAKDGSIHVGCNVENASFGLTLCAERNALVSAVAAGVREFEAVAIAAPGDEPVAWPCGACRQVLAEFGMDWRVLVVGAGETVLRGSLRELLPHNFVLPGGPHGGAAGDA